MSFESEITRVLDCMCSALGDAGWSGDCCVVHGVPSFDAYCADGNPDSGGFAWARLLNTFPSPRFPQEGDRGVPTVCAATQWALVIEVGAVECVCFDMCDCAKKGENAARILKHMEAAIKGTICCLADGNEEAEFLVSEVMSINPQSGLAGFKFNVTVPYLMNCCPPEEA